jgi:hypothetical protein
MTSSSLQTLPLHHAVRAAVNANPGEWTVRTLAEDLDVHPADVLAAVRGPLRRLVATQQEHLVPRQQLHAPRPSPVTQAVLAAVIAGHDTPAAVAVALGRSRKAVWRRLDHLVQLNELERQGGRYVRAGE